MGNLCGTEQRQEETKESSLGEERKNEKEMESEIALESPRDLKKIVPCWKEIIDDVDQKQVELFQLPKGILCKILGENPETAKSARGVCKKLYCIVLEFKLMVPLLEDQFNLFAKFVSTNYLKEDYLCFLEASKTKIFPNIKLTRVVNSDTFQRSCFLNLQSLDISSAGMTDWSNLSHLNQLIHLNLGEAKVSQLDPLSGMVNLKFLNLCRTQINSILPLSNLHELVFLNLSGTKIGDISPLSNMRKLKVLRLGSTHVTSLSPLSECTEIEELDVHNTKDQLISDLTSLIQMKNMKILKLGNSKINDISPLSGMRQLQVLQLNNSQVRDLTPISNLNQLKYLDLSHSPNIFSVAPLSGLHHLVELSFAGNTLLESLWFVNYNHWWPHLKSFNLQLTSISDITFISQMKELEYLNLQSSKVTDKSPLQDLPLLKTVLTEDTKEKTAKAIYEYG
eukprot:TRINITY_DN6506_c0_g3_i1.p1 TRINITY_DN6506_c0_g3~~TRINITY_DN6506_c0_g3_i1.p1  ORF type:complete len:501 (-),score=120.42 TRINITY_DN6506_c0_g3_i1:55-1410(-)